jgi:hypothetical protein
MRLFSLSIFLSQSANLSTVYVHCGQQAMREAVLASAYPITRLLGDARTERHDADAAAADDDAHARTHIYTLTYTHAHTHTHRMA